MQQDKGVGKTGEKKRKRWGDMTRKRAGEEGQLNGQVKWVESSGGGGGERMTASVDSLEFCFSIKPAVSLGILLEIQNSGPTQIHPIRVFILTRSPGNSYAH